jgi:precorrin-4 methylase
VKPPSFLQIQWSVTPGWKAFLATLAPFTQIAPPLSVSEDLTRLSTLTREQQEERLRSLDARGETVLAIYTARRLYGYDLVEAKSFVDRLRGTDNQQRASPM